MSSAIQDHQGVLDFWFAPESKPHWFKQSDAFDQAVAGRLGKLHARARAGEIDGWAVEPGGLLALVILLDQVPRNLQRGTPEAFACDAKALALARLAVDQRMDQGLDVDQRAFLYLPFEHAEDLADQERAVALVSRAGQCDLSRFRHPPSRCHRPLRPVPASQCHPRPGEQRGRAAVPRDAGLLLLKPWRRLKRLGGRRERAPDLLDTALPSVDGRPSGAMPEGLYRFVMAVSWRQQIVLCLLTFLVFPLTLAPLELQRRIINDAIGGVDLDLLLWLGGLYLAAVLVQGVLKYLRNVYLERVGQGIGRRLRRRIVASESFGAEMAEGTKQSLIAAEAEAVGGFAAESLAFPLLQLGIVLSVAGYMLIVDPLVAAVALAFFVPSIVLLVILQPRLNRLTGHKTAAQRELGEAVLEDDRAADRRRRGRGDQDRSADRSDVRAEDQDRAAQVRAQVRQQPARASGPAERARRRRLAGDRGADRARHHRRLHLGLRQDERAGARSAELLPPAVDDEGAVRHGA